MANVNVVVARSDKFPVGTVVSAYGGAQNRHFEGRPSGEALTSATVDSSGRLTFSLPEGPVYHLYAEVAGKPANLEFGAEGFSLLGTLKQRIAAVRARVGA